MSTEFEYYRVHRKNDNTIPLLDADSDCPIYLSLDSPIENPQLMLFELGDPIPKKPKMADYLSSPKSIISKKIYSVLEPLNIEGIQLLPARIRGKNDEIFTDYWAIHIYNRIRCLDVAKSDCVVEKRTLGYVKKLVLNKEVLAAIPFAKRLIFRLGEDSAYELFHVSIVNAINAVEPDGIKFTNIEEWHEGSFFPS